MQSGELPERASGEEGEMRRRQDNSKAGTPQPLLSHDPMLLHFLFMMDMSINKLLDYTEGELCHFCMAKWECKQF